MTGRLQRSRRVLGVWVLGLGARRMGSFPLPSPRFPKNQKKGENSFFFLYLPCLPPPCSVRPYQKKHCLISNMHAFVPSEDGLARRSPARISPANPRFRRTSPNHRHRGWRVPWGSWRLLGVLAYPRRCISEDALSLPAGGVSPKTPEAFLRQPPPRSCDPSRAGTAGPDDAPPKPLSDVSPHVICHVTRHVPGPRA